jgi:ribosome biogenesis GTPase A
VRINPKLELLDTPGIIPMKQEDQERAKKLAFVNSVSENAYSNEIVAQELLDILSDEQAKTFREFYKLPDDKELNIDNISIERNWLLTGGSTDRERTSVYILRDFREGKIGKFIVDTL